MATVFCNPSLPDFVQSDCGVEQGGIVAIGLINDDQSPTLANLREASFWTSKLNASPQKYYVIANTRGSYPGGTPTEVAGFGRQSTIRTGAEHEATVTVPNVAANWAFWKGVNQKQNWHVVFVTYDGNAHYAEDTSVYAKQVIEEDTKSIEVMSVSFKWNDDLSNPQIFDAPSAIFG